MALYLGETKGQVMLTVDGTDTSDANATAADIALGKTAYVQGEKITGELEVSGGVEYEEITTTRKGSAVTVYYSLERVTTARGVSTGNSGNFAEVVCVDNNTSYVIAVYQSSAIFMGHATNVTYSAGVLTIGMNNHGGYGCNSIAAMNITLINDPSAEAIST